jgi:hypothetical protein
MTWSMLGIWVWISASMFGMCQGLPSEVSVPLVAQGLLPQRRVTQY